MVDPALAGAVFGVSIAGSPSSEVARLLAILEKLMPLAFDVAQRGSVPLPRVHGQICLGSAAGAVGWPTDQGKPSLHFAADSVAVRCPPETQARRVAFADHPEVPFPFRNREVFVAVPQARPLVQKSGESVLAADESGPLWTVSVRNSVKHFRTAFGLCGLLPDENFVDVFRAGRFLEVLTLLHFLRVAGCSHVYAAPPLRAAFMFDDPNLHWPTYGYIDFREVARRASRLNFHVSFATIPLDSWFTHRSTAQLFHTNAMWLSLLIHGNNHAKRELATSRDAILRSALLRQALARIEKLESATKLQVCRLMVPPHGACSAQMLAELPTHGYDGACISPGSLIAANPTSPWTGTLGFAPAELIEGCVVLPRDGFGKDLKNALLLNAFLGRPLIVRGHHGDLKDGVELLDNVAQFINGLGDVTWSRLSSHALSSYQFRLSGTECQLLPLASKVSFPPPPSARTLSIQAAGSESEAQTYLVRTPEMQRPVRANEPFELAGNAVHVTKLQSGRDGIDAATSEARPFPKTAVSLMLRRALTEGRDRLLRS